MQETGWGMLSEPYLGGSEESRINKGRGWTVRQSQKDLRDLKGSSASGAALQSCPSLLPPPPHSPATHTHQPSRHWVLAVSTSSTHTLPRRGGEGLR